MGKSGCYFWPILNRPKATLGSPCFLHTLACSGHHTVPWAPYGQHCSPVSLPSDSGHQLGPLSDQTVEHSRNSLDWLLMEKSVPISPSSTLPTMSSLSCFCRDPPVSTSFSHPAFILLPIKKKSDFTFFSQNVRNGSNYEECVLDTFACKEVFSVLP